MKTLTLLFSLLLSCLVSGNANAVTEDAIAADARGFIDFQQSFKDKIGLTQEEQDWLEDHQNIKLAYDGHFPPYSFLNDSGKFEGFSVDVFNIISERLGITFETFPAMATWKELYTAAQNREVDVVATMVKRPERAEWFSFTDPYIYKSLIIIAREDDKRITSPYNIAGKRVALVKKYQYVKRILEEYPSIEPYYVDTMLDGLYAVSTGKVDAAITFMGGGHYLRNKYLLTNIKFAAVYDRKKSLESIGVRSDWPELTSILNKALKSIPESQMQELRARWLPVDFMDTLVEVELTRQEREWIKQHPKIRMGIDPEFAPFEYMDNGQYSGMASDYIKLLNQRLGLNLQIVQGLTWDEAVKKARNKEVDVLPAVGITSERKQFLKYTNPYIKFHRVIVTRIETPFISGVNDIHKNLVGVQRNSSHEGYLKEKHPGMYLVGYDTLRESLLAVSNGDVDAFVGNVASATYWIRKLNLTNLKVAAPVSSEPQNLHFAVRDDWPQLVSILQKGLDSISDRQRRKISEKWLLLQYDPVVDYGLVSEVIIAFTIVLVLALLWNVMLKRKVRQRTSQLIYQAHYDQLTDLPNRFLLLDRLSQLVSEAKRNDSIVAVLSIDLDDFKKVNDTLSHSAGDLLLKETTRRLLSALRDGETLGRPGGDEFVVLISHIEESSDVAPIAEKLLSNFWEPFVFDGRELTITASLGIAIYPGDGDSPQILLKNADSAMHHSKKLGRDNYVFYTEELNRQVSRRLQLEGQMNGALERGEFEVVYQPKVDIERRSIVSFEALLRWHNPELGDVSPVEFIPIAESNSLIEPIGLFVLHEALEALAKWQTQFGQSFSMAVNLSPRQFLSKGLLIDVEDALRQMGVESSALELEITEGVLLSGYPGVERILEGFNELGVKLAMDDFGTGYSSMSYLRKYTFDTLKIDREFIHDLTNDMADRQLVKATIAMAHGLEMKVVAEGVETEEQRSALITQGCDFVQGNLFSKPLPFKKMTDLLEQRQG